MGKVAVFAMLLLAGCTTASQGDFCQVQKQAIRPTQADVAAMSDSLASQILAVNEKGAALCGWKP